MSATNREVILGIGGGIAAYKSADLLRRLQDNGFAITVVPPKATFLINPIFLLGIATIKIEITNGNNPIIVNRLTRSPPK
ncbi:MAG: hypothetical protein RL690_298 [Actinomycetota bacterium]